MELKEIQDALIEIIEEITADWGLPADAVRPEASLLNDIGLSSVDALHMMATFNMRFNRSLPFDKLLAMDANYVKNLTVAQMAAFVAEHFDTRPEVKPI